MRSGGEFEQRALHDSGRRCAFAGSQVGPRRTAPSPRVEYLPTPANSANRSKLSKVRAMAGSSQTYRIRPRKPEMVSPGRCRTSLRPSISLTQIWRQGLGSSSSWSVVSGRSAFHRCVSDRAMALGSGHGENRLPLPKVVGVRNSTDHARVGELACSCSHGSTARICGSARMVPCWLPRRMGCPEVIAALTSCPILSRAAISGAGAQIRYSRSC